MGLLTSIEMCYKEMGPKVGCFAGFYHYHLATLSAHVHAYRYPLKMELKQVCEQLLYVEKI